VIANAESQAALAASRARIVATADQTRRRIERDLHDGAQQRLVSIALELREARMTVPPGAGELAQRLEDAVADVTGVLEELRETARGLHPAILAEGGLRPSLAALARRSAIPVRLDIQVTGRLPEQAEIAATRGTARVSPRSRSRGRPLNAALRTAPVPRRPEAPHAGPPALSCGHLVRPVSGSGLRC